ncbi:uncharacterized protein LOC106653119 [Trichogramma pretiosum]|uniref:uncharacterized protein LOC106653119 n=1 Tax=Trichogramma pretiosum TaxID=7493 RepID=UPI0006C990D0|nr:uncharacterized protein LOC106653119 [Trichogramma pretiosum]
MLANFIAMGTAYFLWDARAIIKLQEYLIANDIEEENLEDNTILTDMLRVSVGSSLCRNPITPELLNKFKDTILVFSIDNWKTLKLYRKNYIILQVACVEYLLYPNKDNEEYKKIYSCDEQKVTEVYNKLFDLPKNNIPDNVTVRAVKSFFSYDILVDDNDYLEIIRLYLRGIDINSRELKYIKNRSIEIINSALDELPAPTRRRCVIS